MGKRLALLPVTERAKDKRNIVINIDKNGEYLSVQFVRDNGEVAIGVYELFGWRLTPSDEREEFEKIIRSPPQKLIGKRRAPIQQK